MDQRETLQRVEAALASQPERKVVALGEVRAGA
jgi:hypothetical protein